jgi:hypothetical protein
MCERGAMGGEPGLAFGDVFAASLTPKFRTHGMGGEPFCESIRERLLGADLTKRDHG